MAAFTPNYGLHQWEPEDQFLRTEFNEDFAKIDEALGEKVAPETLEAVRNALETKLDQKIQMACGTYVGTFGTQSITVGFQPTVVILSHKALGAALFVPGGGGELSFQSNGFAVTDTTEGQMHFNQKPDRYSYLALM